MLHTRLGATLALSIFLLTVTSGASAAHYTIGTGSKGATFYPMAVALCEHISTLALDFSCEAVSSAGSKYNLDGLQRGEFDMALSQLSLQYLAWRGDPPFVMPYRNVRTVSTLHREVFILAIRSGFDASSLEDLKGARLNIGNVGSGSRVFTQRMLNELTLDHLNFSIVDAASADLPELFCSGDIDAAIYSTGHPNDIYRELVEKCGVRLVDLWNDEIAHFVESDWRLTRAEIPRGTYKGIDADLRGFGIQTVISAHRRMSPRHVAKIFEILTVHATLLAEKAPVFRHLEIDEDTPMFAAPYHPGVKIYQTGRRHSNDETSRESASTQSGLH